jgi:hypothetical protein
MLPVLIFALYLLKSSKTDKIRCFFLKTGVHFSFLLPFFFLLDNTNKKLYADVPEMLDFSSKTNTRKYPIFCSYHKLFVANVSDFYH